MKVLTIVGTRPNFIKITQFPGVFQNHPDLSLRILHTGQHTDNNMSRIFFNQFGFEPDYFLNLEKPTPNSNIGEIIIGIEKFVDQYLPDLIMVVGDVNSTLAGAIAANKLGIPLAHLESGLRSRDRSMPEEINRILTDQLADHLFVTEQSGIDNIKKEGLHGKPHFVGNTMIDTLVAFSNHIDNTQILKKLRLRESGYALMTMHRPATVDNEVGLTDLLQIIECITEKTSLVFPIHPRTTKNLKVFGLWQKLKTIDKVELTDPMDYFSFQKLIASAKFVITDSGGIQEETTFRQVPCLTLRPTTERPSTSEIGTNTLITFELANVINQVNEITNGTYKKGAIPELWDGKATERVADVLSSL